MCRCAYDGSAVVKLEYPVARSPGAAFRIATDRYAVDADEAAVGHGRSADAIDRIEVVGRAAKRR